MFNKPNQNLTLETTQLSNSQQNMGNLNNMPQMNPTYPGNISSQMNPTFSTTNNPSINMNPTIVVNQAPLPKLEIRQNTIIRSPIKCGTESITMDFPFCKNPIHTKITETINIKALCACIWLCYCGYLCLQKFRNKEDGCNDCLHICPNCGYKIGNYIAM